MTPSPPQPDWFTQNGFAAGGAPQQSPQSSDWFAQNVNSGTNNSSQGTQSQGFHPLDSIGHGIQEFWKQVDPVTAAKGINDAIHNPAAAASSIGQQNLDLWNKTKAAYDAGDYVSAVRHALNYGLNAIPGVGSAIDAQGDKFASGDYAGGIGGSLGVGANLAAPAVAPKVLQAAGSGLKAAAVPIAESALGVRAIQRAYGKTPGAAALEETSGLRPDTVAQSARDRLADLNTQLETTVSNASAGTTGSLAPARDIVDKRIAQAQAGNSTYVPPVGRGRVPELGQMRQQLTQPGPGFAGVVDPATGQIADDQSPLNILRMKREFGKDFTKWNPLHPQGEMDTARQVYHALDQELDNAVPESRDLNQRISSLIPVAERAEQTDLQAGMGQRLLHRAAAHTGALTGMIGGYYAGGVPGAVAGLVLPEVAAEPAVRMGAARTIYGAGKGIRSAPVQGAAQAGATGAAVVQPDADNYQTRMGRQIYQATQGQPNQAQ